VVEPNYRKRALNSIFHETKVLWNWDSGQRKNIESTSDAVYFI